MNRQPKIITVTLNPCVDRTVQVRRFHVGQTNRVLSAREEIGGKGLNVSRTLVDCGLLLLTAATAPADTLPQIREEFDALRVPTLLVPSPGKTRVNLKIIDADSGEMTELNEIGTPAQDAPDALWAQIRPLLSEAEALVLSGSIPPGTDPHLYARWIGEARSCGVKVILDTSGDALRFGVEALPWAIKPNRAEFASLVGIAQTAGTDAVIPHMQRLQKSGIACVAVSLGADGALFAVNGRVLHAMPFPIRVGSCAAAGDSMTAMLCLSAMRNMSPEDTARLACAAGTCTAAKDGTRTATTAEAAAAAAQIQLTALC